LTRSEITSDLCHLEGGLVFHSESRGKKGYSGVCICVREGYMPKSVQRCFPDPVKDLERIRQALDDLFELSLSHCEITDLIELLESEGRLLMLCYETVWLLDVYCPALSSGEEERYRAKCVFHLLLSLTASHAQLQQIELIILGDFNVAHTRRDHPDPEGWEMDAYCRHLAEMAKDDGNEARKEGKEEEEEEKGKEKQKEKLSVQRVCFEDNPFRQWMSSLLTTGQLGDSWRWIHPQGEQVFSCWNTLKGCRQTNYGTRIDYICLSNRWKDRVTQASIETEQGGSDHAPLWVDISEREPFPWKMDSTACAALIQSSAGAQPEWRGRPARIDGFLKRSADIAPPEIPIPPFPKPQKKSRRVTGPRQPKITAFFGRNDQQSHNGGGERCADMDDGSEKALPVEEKEQTVTVTVTDTDTTDIVRESNLIAASPKHSENAAWKALFSRLPTPNCWHGRKAVERTVLKDGLNYGRAFFVCDLPEGKRGDPTARCNFFQWKETKAPKRRQK